MRKMTWRRNSYVQLSEIWKTKLSENEKKFWRIGKIRRIHMESRTIKKTRYGIQKKRNKWRSEWFITLRGVSEKTDLDLKRSFIILCLCSFQLLYLIQPNENRREVTNLKNGKPKATPERRKGCDQVSYSFFQWGLRKTVFNRCFESGCIEKIIIRMVSCNSALIIM